MADPNDLLDIPDQNDLLAQPQQRPAVMAPIDRPEEDAQDERSLLRSVAGGVTAIGDIAASIPGFVGSLPFAGYELAKTGDPRKALETMGEVTQGMNPLSPKFTYGQSPLQEDLETVRDTPGYRGVMWPVEAIPKGWGNIAGGTAAALGAGPETIEKAGAAGELGVAALMGVAGARPTAGRLAGRIESAKAAGQATAKAKMDAAVKAAEDTAIRLESEKQAKTQQLELFTDERVQPDLRTPYNLKPDEIARLERELNPPVEERTAGQGELFTDFARDDLLLGEGGRAARERYPIQPAEAPKLTPQETYGPRPSVLEEPYGPMRQSMDERPIPYENVMEGARAVQTPGFLRSAEEVMRAREFERAPTAPSVERVRPDFDLVKGQTEIKTSIADLKTEISGLRDELKAAPKEAKPAIREVLQAKKVELRELGGTGKKGFGQGGAIRLPGRERTSEVDAFKKELKARGIQLDDKVAEAVWYEQNKTPTSTASGHPLEQVRTIIDRNKGLRDIREQYVDDRSMPEIIEAMKQTTDIGRLSKNTIDKMIAGRFVAKDHPLLSRTSSEIHRTKNESIQNANKALHGEGGSRSHPTEGSYNFWWNQLKTPERDAVRRVGFALNDVREALTDRDIQAKSRELNGREFSKAELQAYQDRVRINRSLIAEFNKLQLSEGKEPIAVLENYWAPIQAKGPFVVIMYDKTTGVPKFMESSYFRPDEAAIKRKFSEYNVKLIEKGRRADVDVMSVMDMLRMLGKAQADPAYKAISEAYRLAGFRRHGLKRRGVEGGMGATEGSLKDYEKLAENYVREMYEYIGNRKLDKFYQEILLNKELDAHPFAKAYALESIDQARGGTNHTVAAIGDWLANVVSGTSRVLTGGKFILPHKFTRDAIIGANKTQTVLLLGLWNIPFLGAQMAQHLLAIPAIQAKFAKTGKGAIEINKAIFEAMAETYLDMIHHGATGGKNPVIKRFERMGATEATFRYDWSTYAADSMRDYKNTVRDHLSGLSTMSMVEKYGVRTPAALMFLKTLEKLGYDSVAKTKFEKYEIVKEMTDQYMVSNKWYEKPHMFGRAGLAGTILSPLQSFSTTWLGMFREFAKLAAENPINPKYIAPIVSFMGINLMLGGLISLVGTREYDALAMLLNNHFGTNLPTWAEALKTNVKAPSARYGIISDYTQTSVGTTFNSPTLTGSFAPGLQFFGNLAELAVTGGKRLAGKASDVEMREVLRGISPRSGSVEMMTGIPFSHSGVERLLTPKDVPYERNKGGAGFRRDEADWQARKLGTYSLREHEYKTNTFIEERMATNRSKRFSNTMQLIGDRLLTERPAEVEQYVRNLVETEGYTADEIMAGVRQELVSRLVEPQAKAQGMVKSSRQALIYQLLQQLK